MKNSDSMATAETQAVSNSAQPSTKAVESKNAADTVDAQRNVQVQGDSTKQANNESAEDKVDIQAAPALDMVYCEVKIDQKSALYTAQAAGPTLEEAMDNAVDEACALPCAEELDQGKISDDEADKLLTGCTERCIAETIVLAESCTMNGQVIYTEGAWNTEGKDQE